MFSRKKRKKRDVKGEKGRKGMRGKVKEGRGKGCTRKREGRKMLKEEIKVEKKE